MAVVGVSAVPSLYDGPPPIPPKNPARNIVVRQTSLQKVVFMKRNRLNARTPQQPDAQSTSQAPLPQTQPEASSAPKDLTSDNEQPSSLTCPEPAHSSSTRTSYDSSTSAAEATITIHPSPSLHAMQSVGLDTNPSYANTTWRHSYRYISPSQISLAPSVYLPTGIPPWLADSLRHSTRTPPTRYGPSPQDMIDLIERQRTWDLERERKVRNPIKRIVSFSKEITGGLKRRLSAKKGFEPRIEKRGEVVRTKSETQVGKERVGVVRRWSAVASTGER
jgi:hypothetical protein